jgi:diguanylate cyclase (GGDEF)-like protein
MRSSRSGTCEGTSPIDDRQKIVSYHRDGTLPLIQVVEVDGEAVYGTWWRRATAVAGLLAVLYLCVLGLCLALTVGLAGTDPLTGLANRRSFDAALTAAWSWSAASGEPVALLMADADAFKAYNDLFGHQAGDEVLLRVAGCLAYLTRKRGGVACRWGGEEFAVVLRGVGEGEASALSDELCRVVRGLGLEHPRGVGGVVTVSVGVASASAATDVSTRALLASADAALYRAEGEGRDRSCARPRPRAIRPRRSTNGSARSAERAARLRPARPDFLAAASPSSA